MNANAIREIALYEELETSIKLIQLGFGEFQNLDLANDFYYLPFQLLSSGFERLMKCHICLGYHEQNRAFPNQGYVKNLGHDLIKLKDHILNDFYSTENIPLLENDLKYISNNSNLDDLIYLLSEFGKFARYYNLDIATGAINPSIDVKSLWQDYEVDIIVSNDESSGKLLNFEQRNEALDYARREIVIRLERFAASISRQFTMGKLGELALRFSSVVRTFVMMDEEALGTTDYRKQTTSFDNKDRKSHKRNLLDELERATNKNYIHRTVERDKYEGDWPFYHERVIIECRENFWCIVTVEGYDYALNGSAKGRYKLEDPFEAGMAILGKSIGPFIDMALQLGKE